MKTFGRFLSCIGEKEALRLYEEVPFANFGYERLLRLFHQYCLVGGIPSITDAFVTGKTIPKLSPFYETLLEDQFKTIRTLPYKETVRERLLQIYQDAFAFAGYRITFEGFSNPRFRSREVGEAFRILSGTGLFHLLYPVTSPNLPMIPDQRRSPRLHLPDTGLVCYFTGIQEALAGSEDLSAVFNRQIALQVVGQELMEENRNQSVAFWTRPKTQSDAIVDFVIPFKNLLIPVEVKAGEPGRLRSLHQFMDVAPHPFAVQLHAGPLGVRETRTIHGKIFYLMTLPYFLAGKIRDHLEGFIRFVGKASE